MMPTPAYETIEELRDEVAGLESELARVRDVVRLACDALRYGDGVAVWHIDAILSEALPKEEP